MIYYNYQYMQQILTITRLLSKLNLFLSLFRNTRDDLKGPHLFVQSRLLFSENTQVVQKVHICFVLSSVSSLRKKRTFIISSIDFICTDVFAYLKFQIKKKKKLFSHKQNHLLHNILNNYYQ